MSAQDCENVIHIAFEQLAKVNAPSEFHRNQKATEILRAIKLAIAFCFSLSYRPTYRATYDTACSVPAAES